MRAGTATAVVGIAVSLLISALLWWYFGTAVFFLIVPFVPFLFRRSWSGPTEEMVRECPECGFRTTNESFHYCPRDGSRLG